MFSLRFSRLIARSSALQTSLRTAASESADTQLRRLLWQSRKRGISENDLLLSTWFQRNHPSMSPEQINEYDHLINAEVNEWDLFYWISKAKPVPEEFDTETMWALQRHCANEKKEARFHQPVLKYDSSQGEK